MTQNFLSQKSSPFDVLVIGANFSGLLICEYLYRKGLQVALLESSERIGGSYLPMTSISSKNSLPSHLEVYPNHPLMMQNLKWLEGLLQMELKISVVESQILYSLQDYPRPWLGFGEKLPDCYPRISSYLSPSVLVTKFPLSEVIQKIGAEAKFKIFKHKEVTKFILGHENSIEVEVNGEALWKSQQIVSTLSPQQMLQLLPSEGLTPTHRQRLMKADSWHMLSLSLRHRHKIKSLESMDQQPLLFLLQGGNQDFEPTLGRVFPPNEDGSQDSVWFNLIHLKHQDDHDYVGQLLRHIRKQLKRLDPQLGENLVEEKIILTENSHGNLDLNFSKSKNILPEWDHLFWATSYLSDFNGLAAELQMAALFAQESKDCIKLNKNLEGEAQAF
ncbi:MAG: NAD(P)-binding protein [Bdellovibrionales bacterium]|nr:NAD(P)-binding protein [Bdellovibrionales bacterium]